MIKKIENCLYCGEKMESKTAKKKFCCPLHRVYWNREKRAVNILGDAFGGKLPTPTEGITFYNEEVKADVQDKKEATKPQNTIIEMQERVSKIEETLKLPPKYLNHQKKNQLLIELDTLKFRLNQHTNNQ